MRWLRFWLFLTVVALASCSNPAAPRYPQEEKDPGEPDPQKGGFVLSELPSFWV
jgi:hypothetical protein